MKRRSFVKASLLSGLLSNIVPINSFATKVLNSKKPEKQEFYELKVYSFKNENQQKIVQNYFENAAIPAYNRLGCKNIGVFQELNPKEEIKLYVLIPFKSMEEFVAVADNLAKDKLYNVSGEAYLNAPADEPAFVRIESSFMRGFAHMPLIEVPEKKSRLFELRRYESASEGAAKMKIDMFNNKGEIDIFKKDGLKPVFFGETLIGSLMPNLTYMLCFDDMAAHDRNWKVFGSDPEWKKISSVPEYADSKIVSRITSIFLVPTKFSQI